MLSACLTVLVRADQEDVVGKIRVAESVVDNQLLRVKEICKPVQGELLWTRNTQAALHKKSWKVVTMSSTTAPSSPSQGPGACRSDSWPPGGSSTFLRSCWLTHSVHPLS